MGLRRAPRVELRCNKQIMIWRWHILTVVFRPPDSWSNWNLEMLVVGEREKPEYREKNLSEQRREPTQATYGVDAGQQSSRPHWWEASALTTAPPLLPYNRCDYLFHELRRTSLNVISPFVRPYFKNNIYEYASRIISPRETRGLISFLCSPFSS